MKLAKPLFSAAVPSVVVPSLKATLPEAVERVTVAVSVTICPNVDGFGDPASVVTEVLGLTTRLSFCTALELP